MAFLPLLPGSGPAVRIERVRLWTERTGRTLDRRRLNLSISRPLCTRLGWQKGDRIVFAIGLGEDRGKLQIARVERASAGHRLSGFKQSHILRAAVTTPVTLQGEDLSRTFDRFLDPGDLAFTVEDGVLVASLSPSADALSQPARHAPLAVVG